MSKCSRAIKNSFLIDFSEHDWTISIPKKEWFDFFWVQFENSNKNNLMKIIIFSWKSRKSSTIYNKRSFIKWPEIVIENLDRKMVEIVIKMENCNEKGSKVTELFLRKTYFRIYTKSDPKLWRNKVKSNVPPL